MNLDEIKSLIPHRDPFLWIDEVVQWDGNSLHARKTLAEDTPLFQGHYPGFPLLPGVIQCEMALQASAILVSKLIPQEELGNRMPMATRMNDVKFRKIVRPGDTVDIEVTVTDRLADTFFFKGKVSVEGKVSTRLEFAVTVAEMA